VTSCRGAAHLNVEQGVAYLHSFWYEKAAETFDPAAAADSSCAQYCPFAEAHEITLSLCFND
jgi:hypothetical protein